MKTIRMYEVIKEVKIDKSRIDGSYIFVSDSGRVYFIDKANNENYDKITDEHLGTKILVAVVKEIEQVGFVQLVFNHKPLAIYIEDLNNPTIYDKKRYLSNDIDLSEQFLSNYMCNHDRGYNKADIKLTGVREAVNEYYEANGINSEKSEFIYELIRVHQYIIDNN